MFRLNSSVDFFKDAVTTNLEKDLKPKSIEKIGRISEQEAKIRYQQELYAKQQEVEARREKEEAIKRQGAQYALQQRLYTQQQAYTQQQQGRQAHVQQTQQAGIQQQKQLIKKSVSQPKKKESIKQKSYKSLGSSGDTKHRVYKIMRGYSKDTQKKILALDKKDFHKLMQKRIKEEINKEIATGLKNTNKKDIREIMELAKQHAVKEGKNNVKHRQKLFLAGFLPIIIGLAATGIVPSEYTILGKNKSSSDGM